MTFSFLVKYKDIPLAEDIESVRQRVEMQAKDLLPTAYWDQVEVTVVEIDGQQISG